MKNTAYKIREQAFNEMQKEAGLVLTYFDFDNPYEMPDSKDILLTTEGGLHVKHEVPLIDRGEGIDNCPEGILELQEKGTDNISLEFTSVTFNPDNIAMDIVAADVGADSNGITHIVPRANLKTSDAKDLICLFGMPGGGMCYAYLKKVLSAGGLDMQTTKNDRGTRAVSLKPHRTLATQNIVPVEYGFIPAPNLATITVISSAGTAVGTSDIAISGYTLGTGESFKYNVDTNVISVQYGDIIGAAWSEIETGDDITATTGMKITVVAVDADGYAIAEGHATVEAKAGA